MRYMVLVSLTLGLLAFSSAAKTDNYVRGHTRSDGTYVQPHYRTNPNSSAYDNYSTKGNVNPYTGEQGTVDPYKTQQPSYGNSLYGNQKKW